jgi:hypothetical protein
MKESGQLSLLFGRVLAFLNLITIIALGLDVIIVDIESLGNLCTECSIILNPRSN